MTPTQRTLQALKAEGYTAAIVERWNPHVRIRQDLFGVIDVLAVHPGAGVLGVQATSGSNAAARRAKALAEPRLRVWLAAGGVFEIWGWAKRGARGKRKTWTVRRVAVTLDDFPATRTAQDQSGDEGQTRKPVCACRRGVVDFCGSNDPPQAGEG